MNLARAKHAYATVDTATHCQYQARAVNLSLLPCCFSLVGFATRYCGGSLVSACAHALAKSFTFFTASLFITILICAALTLALVLTACLAVNRLHDQNAAIKATARNPTVKKFYGDPSFCFRLMRGCLKRPPRIRGTIFFE